MPFHAIATLVGGGQKTVPNRSEESMLLEVVIPFITTRNILAPWRGEQNKYATHEVAIYETDKKWDKRSGPLSDLIKRRKNKWPAFEEKANKYINIKTHRIFYITPIQGERYGDQDRQRIFKEYNDRYDTVQSSLNEYGATVIRIDKENTLEELVQKIKKEIRISKFIICDLTDERPSCYFEAGFAEALQKPVIYIASKQSVITPGSETKIHFDIHKNVQFFTNLQELGEKLQAVLSSNSERLFSEEDSPDSEPLSL